MEVISKLRFPSELISQFIDADITDVVCCHLNHHYIIDMTVNDVRHHHEVDLADIIDDDIIVESIEGINDIDLRTMLRHDLEHLSPQLAVIMDWVDEITPDRLLTIEPLLDCEKTTGLDSETRHDLGMYHIMKYYEEMNLDAYVDLDDIKPEDLRDTYLFFGNIPDIDYIKDFVSFEPLCFTYMLEEKH